MMTGYTDIHTHIIPGVDDGAKNLTESLEMIDLAYREGVRCMIATSHYDPAEYHYTAEELQKRFREVCLEAQKHHPDMKLYLGNELFYRDSVLQDLREGKAQTMCGSRYVLTEFPFGIDYPYIYQGLRRLTEGGYLPILAHIERYGSILKNSDHVTELRKMGIQIQVNADSFTGGLFDPVTRFCTKLAKEGNISYLGSDCHGSRHRTPKLKAGVEKYEKKAGAAIAEKILYENPEKLFKGAEK